MFVIGRSTSKVCNGKLQLPKEYHLRNKVLLCKWRNSNSLYISDSEGALNYVVGKESLLERIRVDTETRIPVPDKFEGMSVKIVGDISTVEVTFTN